VARGNKGIIPIVLVKISAETITSKGTARFGNSELFSEMYDLASQFNDRQLELADSTGFGIFARLRLHFKFDQAFSMWLMGRVDCTRECITLPKGSSVGMFPQDVNRIFGVPNNGVVPWHHSLDKSGRTLENLERMIGLTERGGSCNAAAESFIRRCVDGTVVWDRDSFTVCLVVGSVGWSGSNPRFGDGSNP